MPFAMSIEFIRDLAGRDAVGTMSLRSVFLAIGFAVDQVPLE